jgi:hypothetical protein
MHYFIAALILALTASAQTRPRYDLLLKGGHVIDPKNNRNGPMDVAVENGKVARVAANIPASLGEVPVSETNLGAAIITASARDARTRACGFRAADRVRWSLYT